MQGHLHHPNHLAALLSSAVPDADADRTDLDRAAALASLHRALTSAPNSLLVSRSALFLSQGLSNLLSDRCHAVRSAAAVAYGSLCAVVCSTNSVSDGRQSTGLASGLPDSFIGWALPLLRDVGVGNGTASLALEGLREFLSGGEAASTEKYILPILKSCQLLLEDERTSLSLLFQILDLLSLISFKYGCSFQPHFVDMIDLLLGWALMPDLSESDMRLIMKAFLQFKTHWLSNLQFSIGLLSKFLGDLEVLIQDAGLESAQQLRRFLALFSCFSTVLEATTSDVAEKNLVEEIIRSLEKMTPQLLSCISVVGKKFGSESWIRESWRCLTLIAGILKENFSRVYDGVIDILFHSLKVLPAHNVPEILKTNLQLLTLQSSSLLPSSVKAILMWGMPFSRLRLHPNNLIVGNLAMTYLFLVQHGTNKVVSETITSLLEELNILKILLNESHRSADGLNLGLDSTKVCSKPELISLAKFDLKVLLSCVSLGKLRSIQEQSDMAILYHERSKRLSSFIVEVFDPFDSPTKDSLDLQVHVIKSLHMLSKAEFLSRLYVFRNSKLAVSGSIIDGLKEETKRQTNKFPMIIECINKFDLTVVRALSGSSPFSVKVEGVEWILTLCEVALNTDEHLDLIDDGYRSYELPNISNNILSAILDAASDVEQKVRLKVALAMERLVQTRLISPWNFYLVAEVALERLGDPNPAIKSAFTKVLSVVLPLTFYSFGTPEDANNFYKIGAIMLRNKHHLNWKQELASKQFSWQLKSQQLVSIISYISQRWKVPLSSWIRHLVLRCGVTVVNPLLKHEDMGSGSNDGMILVDKTKDCMLGKLSPVNNLAAIWWSIHEAARHCVALRLRTNLGGPTQTFAALERMLLDVTHELSFNTGQTDSSLNIGTSNFHLLPMRLLLDFVESLKKNVYNAYEGSCILPSATRPSSLFFKANRKVCEEWFSRISGPMLNAALALQCHHATIHYSSLRLQDLQDLLLTTFKDKKRGSQMAESFHEYRISLAADVLKVLHHFALALCRNRESEALVGLQNWAVVTFSPLFDEEKQIKDGLDGGSMYFSWITGLVYQARGQYEKAAAHFSHLLQSEDVLSFIGADGIQFVIARVIESYAAISDWKSLETWLSELQSLRASHAGKGYSGALTAAGNEINAVHALARFDEEDMDAACTYLDLTPKSSNELTLDPRLALERSEYTLLRAMLQKDRKSDKVLEDINKARVMIDEVLSVAPLDGLAEATPYATQLHCIFAFEEATKLDVSERERHLSPILSSLHQVFHLPISKVHQDSSLWLKVFRVYRTILPNSEITLLLCQKLVTLARKQGNFLMANRMRSYLKENILVLPQGEFSTKLSTFLQYESCLLKYAEGWHDEALADLWSLIHSFVLSPSNIISESCKPAKAKACLKLSNWLKQERSSINMENAINKICADFDESRKYDGSFGSSKLLPGNHDVRSNTNRMVVTEEICGIAIKLSHQLCPAMCKTWLSYASWCYTQAANSLTPSGDRLQTCTLSSVLTPELSLDIFQLTEEEVSKVADVITNFFQSASATDKNDAGLFNQGNKALLNSFVCQAIYLIESSAGIASTEYSTGESPSSAITSQLQELLLCAHSKTEQDEVSSYVSQLVDVWWLLRRRRVSLFGHAAYGYLQYLSYSSSKSHYGESHSLSLKEKAGTGTLRATLYVLHIILNYGVELRETIEPSLALAPLLPWQEITPQLFARLSSHPQREVRIQLEGLLMMLAKEFPWSIVYPTIVDINNSDEEPSEELQRIFHCLVKLYPLLVKDVQLVMNELGNITVLWEEQWLSTLQDLHADVVRRLSLLKEEAKRIADNASLSHSERKKINAAKFSAMMAPIVVALERRLASTSRKPVTSHEEWFQKEYVEQLRSSTAALKIPPVSLSALADVWRPFDSIAASLANHQRKSATSLSLREVAPRLVLLTSSEVPMPGLEKQICMHDMSGSSADLQGLVRISSFCDHMAILSTKTKPKKLVILGSDGQKYTYLLKGREDLRLDARIMQLLQAVNSFFHSSTDIRGHSLAIRYYSVTPISGRAGLIQWVDDLTSIYSIFKSWQTRIHLGQISGASAGNMQTPLPPVPRPSDMFYGKIIPALKEKGIKRVISRRDWPQEVKKKVLLELMNEVPKRLLFQEIWCSSEGFKAFRSKTKRFSSSVAVMSMVGHILGLGDRHLDNILIDFVHGDIVHIDYNVCFDKGRRLKIPEIVPFRLTQIIETALGLTGTEGTFKANCEAVIGVLRKNKDVLLMLLEVFVWDPLVEWTRGDMHDEAAIGGEEKKGMELAVSLSLFASRFQEIRAPLQEHHDLLVTSLPAAEYALEKFLDVLNQYEAVSAVFYHADREMSILLHGETSAKSFVAEATTISEKSLASFELHSREFAEAKSVATEKAQELAKWLEEHGRVLDALRSDSIPELHEYVNLCSMKEGLSLKSAVLVAGVPLTVVPEPTQAQSYDLDRDIFHFSAELDNGVSFAIEALKEYSVALQRVLPVNYITTSPVSGWAQVLELSVNSSLSPEILSVAGQKAADLIAKVKGNCYDSIQQRHGGLFLNLEKYVLQIEKVKNDYSELMNSVGSDLESRAKAQALATLSKYMQFGGCLKKENDSSFTVGEYKHDHKKYTAQDGDLKERERKIYTVLCAAAHALFDEIKHRVIEVESRLDGDGFSSGIMLFEEQIEKSVIIVQLIDEFQQLVRFRLTNNATAVQDECLGSEENWASVFQASVCICKALIQQIMEVILPEIIGSVLSCHTEVIEAFGFISQIRGSIDAALEQFAKNLSERASLVDLENNYFTNFGLIKQQQLSLEEAATKGRDNLYWEEAEELASQAEACRVQLEQLHQAWNNKDMLRSSLTESEASIRSQVISSERKFSALTNIEEGGNQEIRKSRILLAMLAKPFYELETLDEKLSSNGALASNSGDFSLPGFASSDYSPPQSMWKISGLLKTHSFFIWKVGIIDMLIDSCIHDISSLIDHNLDLEQLVEVLQKKYALQLHKHVSHYLRERVVPIFLLFVQKQIEHLQKLSKTGQEVTSDQVVEDVEAVKVMQIMLEEYCNAHETARVARTAMSLLKRQLSEHTNALHKTIIEIVQNEWLYDSKLPYTGGKRTILQNLVNDAEISSTVLNLDRAKLLEKLQSSMSMIGRALECLQDCERTSVAAEAQLERAMGWACAGSYTSGFGKTAVKSSGIPSEFHDHLLRRRQWLRRAQEQASNIMRISTSIMEFEASRDGLFRIPGELTSRTDDGRAWQKSYMNVLTRLDGTFHSFTRAETEQKVAQNRMEAAADNLLFASNELCNASKKAKVASDDMHDTLRAMKETATEACSALSAFCHVSRGHTALTSECGSILEEVLAVTEDLHDVHGMGKKASGIHSKLLANLAKATMVLVPLEGSLSTDIASISGTGAISKDNINILPVHGQSLYQSYYSRIRDSCQTLRPLVPSIISAAKELNAMMTMLARTASAHAGNLHKAFEGLGESQHLSQELAEQERNSSTLYSNEQDNVTRATQEDNFEVLTGIEEPLHDEEWISPPSCTYSSSEESTLSSTGVGLSGNLDRADNYITNNVVNESPDILSSSHLKAEEGGGLSRTRSESAVIQENNEINPHADKLLEETEPKRTLSLSTNTETSDSSSLSTAEKGVTKEMDPLGEERTIPLVKKDNGQIKENENGSRITRGKNAYALSVLNRIHTKLDGRDIDVNRPVGISEQVDYLIKQATSIDNLCNMYEGWTPWI